jgi:formate hydrogenlyase subunit 6/NADH:ubiquinone oxidoreductase subunit I
MLDTDLPDRVKKRVVDEVFAFGIARQMDTMSDLETALEAKEGTLTPSDDAPERFETPQRYAELRRERGPGELTMMTTWDSFAGTVSNARDIVDGLERALDADVEPDAEVPPGFLDDFEAGAKAMGVSSVGYTDVREEWVFQDNGILYDHAIVLTMPMDKDALDEAPSAETLDHVITNYGDLGEIVEDLAQYLRDRGYAAQAGHPQMGQAHYPTLAEAANLGYRGKHRLIMTPEAGPRVRVGAIYTNVSNLPVPEENDHEWIADYCDNCNLCVRECPADAIPEETTWTEDGRMDGIDEEACFEEFSENYGCAVCVKVCPFNQVGYDRIHDQYQKMQAVRGDDGPDDGDGPREGATSGDESTGRSAA